MALLKLAVNQTAFLKAGAFGFPGSGKTYTASHFAMELAKYIGKPKCSFYDTETGSDFMIPKFKAAEVELAVVKSRAFVDACEFIRESEATGYGVAIIDSISHVWRELCDSYLKSKKAKRLSLPDWGYLKNEWGKFTDLYLTSKLHIIMLGRAGYEYEMSKDDDTGKWEAIKAGTKMKVESEFGFEPSLLFEMERVKAPGKKKGFAHKCTILKDRTDMLNGAEFLNPTFKDFQPIIDFLSIGGEHLTLDTGRTSAGIFDANEDVRKIRHQIAIENLAETLILGGLSGQSQEQKIDRIRALTKVFGTSSKAGIERLPTDKLEAGVMQLKKDLKVGQSVEAIKFKSEDDIPL